MRVPSWRQANLSVHDAREMLALETKWAAWLGTVSPDGGLVGTYEGGFYTQFGVFRPSLNSLMKELLREFNSPSREKMIQSYYSTATPIDSVRPRGAFVRRKSTVTLDPLPTATDIRWYVGNKEVRRWRGRLSVRLTGIPASAGSRARVGHRVGSDIVGDRPDIPPGLPAEAAAGA